MRAGGDEQLVPHKVEGDIRCGREINDDQNVEYVNLSGVYSK